MEREIIFLSIDNKHTNFVTVFTVLKCDIWRALTWFVCIMDKNLLSRMHTKSCDMAYN